MPTWYSPFCFCMTVFLNGTMVQTELTFHYYWLFWLSLCFSLEVSSVKNLKTEIIQNKWPFMLLS